MYLADLGLHTNPDGFWALSQNGLHALPGTILIEKRMEGGLTHPILVVAKPTIEHPGTILLKFNGTPTLCKRTKEDLEPFWIPVPTPPTSSAREVATAALGALPATLTVEKKLGEESQPAAESLERNRPSEATEDTVHDTHFRISHKGIVERRLSNGKQLPVHGLAFWFPYSILGTCAQDSVRSYNGQPFGFRIRLQTLFISRECVVPVIKRGTDQLFLFLRELISLTKMRSIPTEWTEDSPARNDARLNRRFELEMSDEMRNRAKYFREQRNNTMRLFQDTNLEAIYVHNHSFYIPLEVLEVTPNLWCKIVGDVDSSYMSPLLAARVPTSQEICVAAVLNGNLATDITSVLMSIARIFQGEEKITADWRVLFNNAKEKAVFMCAIIIMQSIADSSPYLAGLSDVQECISKWNPAYLC